MSSSCNSLPRAARPTSSGRSVPGPRYWQPNQTVPDGSVSMWRIDSWCSAAGNSCFSIRSPVTRSMKHKDGFMVAMLSSARPIIRMGLDAAIGDRQRPAVAQQQKLVRADAIGREFADAAEFRPRVVDADHAGGVVEVVLGGVEQRAVGREHAMAEEMPAGDAGDGQRRVARRCDRRRRRRCRAGGRRPPSASRPDRR